MHIYFLYVNDIAYAYESYQQGKFSAYEVFKIIFSPLVSAFMYVSMREFGYIGKCMCVNRAYAYIIFA